jgi:hypothetical protein
VRLVNGGGSNGTRSAPARTQSTPIQPPAPTTPTKPSTPVPGPTPTAATTTLRTQHFTVQVPRGWTQRTSAGGLLLQPLGGGRANVQIFFQRSPTLSLGQMTRQTAQFLRREVPGASLFPRRTQIGGLAAYQYTARGPGETAIAVDLLRGPYRYLLVRRIFAGATPHVSLATGRVVLSFRPR